MELTYVKVIDGWHERQMSSGLDILSVNETDLSADNMNQLANESIEELEYYQWRLKTTFELKNTPSITEIEIKSDNCEIFAKAVMYELDSSYSRTFVRELLT